MNATENRYRTWASPTALLLYLAAVKVLIHFFSNGTYGYFRDELYYIACSDHLAWGYVDHPPLSLAILKIARLLLGDSIFAIRLPVVLCGAACVVLTGLLARELGGGRFAQALAALAYLVMAVPLGLSSFFSMNSFDHLFWILCAWVFIHIMRTGNPMLWIAFGAVAGVGMLNKISIGFFGFGVVIGLILTSHRKHFLSPWIWIGGAVAFLIFLPHVVWQFANDWPTLEFMGDAKELKIVSVSPLGYLASQLVDTNPLTLPIWLTGLAYFLFGKRGQTFRPLAWAYLAILTLFIVKDAKAYYLAPAYPMLYAGGAVAIETFAVGRRRSWLKPTSIVLLVASVPIVAPMAIPILPPETYLKYQDFVGFEPPREEVGHDAAMPQHFADRFGWENMVATVAKVYRSLPPEDRERCTIYASNYGEAGAIDFFGPRYGLPKAVSAHNNYYFWGPGDGTGEVVIAVGWMRDLGEHFEEVVLADTAVSKYAEQDRIPIHVCRKLNRPLEEMWPELKNFI